MKVLLKNDRSPIWLFLACEELRVFGDFRHLQTKIESLPDDSTELSWYIVRRLINEDDEKLGNVEKFTKYLACETKGFYENLIPSLLGSLQDEKLAAYSNWNAVKIRLKPFLRFNDGKIDFKHYPMRQVNFF